MKPAIAHAHEKLEHPTPERCAILEIWNNNEDAEVSIAQARVTPGIHTQAHSLNGITERYLIISGTGIVHIDGLTPTRLGPGDVAFIPPDAIQWIENVGDEDLIFYAICTPRFQSKAYRDRSNG